MTGYNLPPGCRECDLPGNRPEDVAYDHWLNDCEDERMDYLDCLCEDWGVETQGAYQKLKEDGGDSFNISDDLCLDIEWDGVFEKWHENSYADRHEPEYDPMDRYERDHREE